LNALALSIAIRFSQTSCISGWLDLHFETQAKRAVWPLIRFVTMRCSGEPGKTHRPAR